MTRIYFLLLVLFTSTLATAQESGMEEYMYSSGKINVVIAVVLIILAMLFIYLFRLDRKVKELEE